MVYTRRYFMSSAAAAGVGVLSGCRGNDDIEAVNQSIQGQDSACNGTNDASINVANKTEVSVEGIIPAMKPCPELNTIIYTSNGEESPGHVHIDIDSQTASGKDCEPCAELTYISYTASFSFSTQLRALKVFHLWDEDNGGIELMTSRLIGTHESQNSTGFDRQS